MSILTKQQILQADDLPRELVSIPAWGGDVYIRTMTGTERDIMERDTFKRKGDSVEANYQNFRARLCALCICNEKGERLFTDDDVLALGAKSALVLDDLASRIQKLNGYGSNDIEEMVKN